MGSRNGRNYQQAGDHRIKDHRFWAPLIGLFSGARLNEIGQLRKGDVERVAEIWCFRITDEGEDERSVKTSAGKRVVPMHQELIQLGLLDYLAMLGMPADP